MLFKNQPDKTVIHFFRDLNMQEEDPFLFFATDECGMLSEERPPTPKLDVPPSTMLFKDDILDYLTEEAGGHLVSIVAKPNACSEETSAPSALGLEGMEKVRNENGDAVYRFPIRRDDRVIADILQGSHGFMVENAANGDPVCFVDTRCFVCKKQHHDMQVCSGCEHVSFCGFGCRLLDHHWCSMFNKARMEYETKVEMCVDMKIGLTVLINFDVCV